jgi:predicted DsbA family dithiol-disulfide isomerase
VAHALAMVNSNVTADVVEAQEFPDLARRYRVSSVPKTVINDTAEFVGAMPEELFLNAVLQALGSDTIDFDSQDDAFTGLPQS